MSKVAIVILNYNGVNYLQQFLPLVIQHSPDSEIIVADNCSTDDSVNYLRTEHEQIQLILIDTNLGYAGGYNEALSTVEADYYILLNSDVEVTPNWLDPLIQFLDEHKDYAAVQPKILDFNNKTTFEYAGAAGGYLDFLGYPYCRGRIFNELEKDVGQYDSNENVMWCSGACLVIRSSDFKSVGGFDKDFFAHMEEIDLCWRLSNAGRKLACIPSSVIFHIGGGTLNKTSPFKTFLNFRNNLSMLAKNLTWSEAIFIIPIRMILDLIAGLKFWKEQSFDHFIAILKSQIAFIKKLPETLSKRKYIKNPLHRRKILLVEYFVFRKKIYDDLNNTK